MKPMSELGPGYGNCRLPQCHVICCVGAFDQFAREQSVIKIKYPICLINMLIDNTLLHKFDPEHESPSDHHQYSALVRAHEIAPYSRNIS